MSNFRTRDRCLSFENVCHSFLMLHRRQMPWACKYLLHLWKCMYVIQLFLPNSTFFKWLMRGFHRTFATGVACWQGTLTPADTWSRPIWDLHMFYLLRPVLFSNLSVFFRTMHFEYPSVLSRFCSYLLSFLIDDKMFLSSGLYSAKGKTSLFNVTTVRHKVLLGLHYCPIWVISKWLHNRW